MSGNPRARLVGMPIGAAAVENSMEVPQKIEDGNALWLGDSTSGYLSEETPNTNSKNFMHPYVHCSIINNRQDMETTQVPINRWADKKDMVHLHDGILLSHKSEWNLTTCMDGPRGYYAKWNKINIIWLNLYVESKEQNKWTNKIETNSDTENRWWLPEGRSIGGLGEKD